MPATKRSGDTEAKILNALRAGHTKRVAAGAAGINLRTLNEWCVADANFEQAVYEAESEAERFHVANINRAASAGMWTASAWWLERRRAADYSRVDRTVAIMHVEIEELREELKREGIEITEADLMKEYATLSKGQQSALPSGRRSK